MNWCLFLIKAIVFGRKELCPTQFLVDFIDGKKKVFALQIKKKKMFAGKFKWCNCRVCGFTQWPYHWPWKKNIYTYFTCTKFASEFASTDLQLHVKNLLLIRCVCNSVIFWNLVSNEVVIHSVQSFQLVLMFYYLNISNVVGFLFVLVLFCFWCHEAQNMLTSLK